MKVVLDTNVLVAGMLARPGPPGPPGLILEALAAGDFELCLDDRILAEYLDVLSRRHLKIKDAAVPYLMHTVATRGHLVSAPRLDVRLPDPDDLIFLEVAVASQADYLVTGNLKDFPADKTQGIAVVSPRQFLDLITP